MSPILAILLLFALVILMFYMAIRMFKKQKKEKLLFAKDYNIKEFIKTGSLVNGHPNIDNAVTKSGIILKDDDIIIFQYFDEALNVMPKKIASIPKRNIKNILAEDQSTIEKRITATRMVLVGVFALAWKKKEKNELSYLTIFWNDGRFDHETIFEFKNKNSIQVANSVRNKLINNI